MSLSCSFTIGLGGSFVFSASHQSLLASLIMGLSSGSPIDRAISAMSCAFACCCCASCSVSAEAQTGIHRVAQINEKIIFLKISSSPYYLILTNVGC